MTCQHLWKIETPNGQKSQAECAHCHALRDFYNHMEAKDIKARKRAEWEEKNEKSENESL